MFGFKGGRYRLDRANEEIVDAAYTKAAVSVESRARVLRAEAKALEAREAINLSRTIPRLFEEDTALTDPPPPPERSE